MQIAGDRDAFLDHVAMHGGDIRGGECDRRRDATLRATRLSFRSAVTGCATAGRGAIGRRLICAAGLRRWHGGLVTPRTRSGNHERRRQDG